MTALQRSHIEGGLHSGSVPQRAPRACGAGVIPAVRRRWASRRTRVGRRNELSDLVSTDGNSEIPFYRLDGAFRFVAVSDTALHEWGKSRAEMLGRPLLDVFPQAAGSASWQHHLAVARSRRPVRAETVSPVLRCWIDLVLHPDHDCGMSVSFRRMADRRRQEAAEAEVRHRLANDMQFVLSQLELARRRLGQHDAVPLLDRAIARTVFSGRLQRQLLGPPDELIDPAPILTEAVAQTLGEFPGLQRDLRLGTAVLPRARLAPLVLLVWEAATNAGKHVFRPGHGNRFTLVLARDAATGAMDLAIEDDGPGLPAAFAFAVPGFGRDIMRELAGQLGGTLEIASGPGTRLHLRFFADPMPPSAV